LDFFIIVLALIVGGYFSLIYFPRATKDTIVGGGGDFIDLAKRVVDAIDRRIGFTPKVTTQEKTVIEASKRITEFSVIEEKIPTNHVWTHTWLGSTKEIEMAADFTVKAGFDLSQPFSIDISPDVKVVRTQFPKAKITSNEGSNYKTIKALNGWWNSITNDERDAVIKELKKQAEAAALDKKILLRAEESLKESVEEVIRSAAPSATIMPHPLP
jgi:hypothetical protein